MVLKPVFVLGLLLIVGNVAAESNEISFGLYNITYDLGNIQYEFTYLDSDLHATNNPEPQAEEQYDGTQGTTYAGVFIFGDGEYIYIRSKQWNDNTRWVFADGHLNYYDWGNADGAYLREIDGHTAVLLVNDGSTPEQFRYSITYTLQGEWVDADGDFTGDKNADRYAVLSGKTWVTILSDADWDTTRQLLNTIHVEKAV